MHKEVYRGKKTGTGSFECTIGKNYPPSDKHKWQIWTQQAQLLRAGITNRGINLHIKLYPSSLLRSNMGAKPFKTLWKTLHALCKKHRYKAFSTLLQQLLLKKSPNRHLTLNLGFVIQQVFFPLLGSNIIVQAVEEILFVVIVLFTKAVNDTKQGFCLFLQSAEHYASCKERIYTGFHCELQSCLLAGCSWKVCMHFFASSNGIFKWASGASFLC